MGKTSRMAAASTVLVALAALCWGLAGGIGGILLDDGWDPFVASFYRGLVGLVFVLAWLALRPQKSGLSNPRLWFWSVVAGLGVAGNFAFYFVSIANGSVAVAATLMYSAPVFVFVASFALGLERPTALKLAAIAVVMVGIVLLTQIHDVGGSGITLVGVGAGLLAGLSYALFIFGLKYATPHGSPQAILTIAFAVLAVVLVWPGEADQLLSVPGSPDLALILALGVLGAGLSFVLYVIGLEHTAPAVAAIVAMVEPVTASAFSVAILDERLAGLQIVGMVLILITVTALSVSSSSNGSESSSAL